MQKHTPDVTSPFFGTPCIPWSKLRVVPSTAVAPQQRTALTEIDSFIAHSSRHCGPGLPLPIASIVSEYMFDEFLCVACGSDSRAFVWETSGTRRKCLPMPGPASMIRALSDGRVLVVSKDPVFGDRLFGGVWDHDGPMSALGNLNVSLPRDLWLGMAVVSDPAVASLSDQDRSLPSGELIVCEEWPTGSQLSVQSASDYKRICKLNTGQHICSVLALPQGRLLVGTSRGEVQLWTIADGQCVARTDINSQHAHGRAVWHLQHGVNGGVLSISCDRVNVWGSSPITQPPIHTVQAPHHIPQVRPTPFAKQESFRLSADMVLVVWATDDRGIVPQFVSLSSGKVSDGPVLVYVAGRPKPRRYVAACPLSDGQIACAQDNQLVAIYDPIKQQHTLSFAPSGTVLDKWAVRCMLGLTGARVAVACADGSIGIWDTRNGQRMALLQDACQTDVTDMCSFIALDTPWECNHWSPPAGTNQNADSRDSRVRASLQLGIIRPGER